MLIFKNKGVIPEDAITISGVSAKVGDNPIGVFGTGLKYTIAIVLRLGGSITIYRGLKKLEFARKNSIVRGKEFHIITMNGKKLGFTDRLGLNWEPWMAYRELYSNMLDENGSVARLANDGENIVQPEKGCTMIVIDCIELEKVHEERNQIVLMSEPMFSLPGVNVHAGESLYVYYKGIRVHKLQKKSLYTYNISEATHLTEDRTLLYPWMVQGTIVKAVVQCTDIPFLTKALSRNDGTLENDLPYEGVKSMQPTPQFMEIAEQLKNDKLLCGRVSHLFEHYKDTLPGYVSPYLVELTGAEKVLFRTALDEVLARVPYLISENQFEFKSKLEHGRVQVSRRKIIITHKAVETAFVDLKELKEAILEGIVLKNGGGLTDGLVHLVLTGELPPAKSDDSYTATMTQEQLEQEIPF